MQEAFRTPRSLDQNRTTPHHIIIQTTSTENKKRVWKVVREKMQLKNKDKTIKITTYFSMETLKVRRAWSEVFQALNENNFNTRILYPAKLSFKIDGIIKVFHDIQKPTQYITQKPLLQKILQGILHTENENKQNHEKAHLIKPQKKKRQESRVTLIQLHTIKSLKIKKPK
jgi:hypothetical protein